jgi:hypothetical protein
VTRPTGPLSARRDAGYPPRDRLDGFGKTAGSPGPARARQYAATDQTLIDAEPIGGRRGAPAGRTA